MNKTVLVLLHLNKSVFGEKPNNSMFQVLEHLVDHSGSQHR